MRGTKALLLALLLAACDATDQGDRPAAPDADSTAVAVAPDSVVIDEWDVPFRESRPRDPAVAPNGRIWFVGQAGNYVARFDPRTRVFSAFVIPDGALPHNVIVGADGTVWYAGNQAAHVGRIDPVTADVRIIAMPDSAARDPHTLVFGEDGRIWFTVQQGAFVGRLDPATERVDLVRMPAGSRPYGIVADSGGGAWAALFGTNRIVRVAPDLTTRDYPLPHPGARPRRLARASDGGVWYVDHARGMLARLDPADGAVREWPVPGGPDARPYAMAIDDRDHVWFVETGSQPNRFVGFDPEREEFTSKTPVPSGGVSVRHMVFDPVTRAIWFGTDQNTLARARLP